MLAILLGIAVTSASVVGGDRLQPTGRGKSRDGLEDSKLSTLGLIAKNGYKGEEHLVQTADGYILALHRVLPAKLCPTRKKVLLLQHGIIASSADWVMTGPSNAFAYLLSDACHDVWLGNSRGNTYSRRHVILNPKTPEFWDFSWHEMGLYDLPAMIDYILHETRSSNLSYIGHSQGTTEFFVFSSLKPEYRNKVDVMFALAPVAFMGNSNSPMIKGLAKISTVLGFVCQFFGIYELLPNFEFLSLIAGNLCSDDHPKTQSVCIKLISEITGYDPAQMNTTILPMSFGHIPAGSATKQFLHYAQLINSGGFQMYDHDPSTNIEVYGRETPPIYPLEKIEIPVALLYGANDLLADVRDVNNLYENLKNPIGKFLVNWRQWNHEDFVWGIDAKHYVYGPIIQMLENYF